MATYIPAFDPVALNIGPVSVHWYGLMYLFGFASFLVIGKYRIKNHLAPRQFDKLTMVDDLLFYGVIGVILGGRLGFVLFYQPYFYLENPIKIVKIWEGGMSFHGGLIGVIVTSILFSRRRNVNIWSTLDFVAVIVPIGLFFGRIGNFINGELYGRITDPNAFWAVVFERANETDLSLIAQNPTLLANSALGGLARHPSQIYEVILEGLVLFMIMWLVGGKVAVAERRTKSRSYRGIISASFLIGYGMLRFLVEFTRQPDDFVGELPLNLTMGQYLSAPMIVVGLLILVFIPQKGSR